jgi:hypothetical protein
MVLIMARQGGWTAGRLDSSKAVAKALKTKLNFKGAIRPSPLR